MNPMEFIARRKTHLVFVFAFLVAVVNMTIGLTSGESFLGATLTGVSQIRPMDYGLFALFWYACAAHPPKDDWQSSLISLNLAGKKF
ncbi:MAG TPA: hypothetical protein VLG74_06635 [Blastocatellia bacterium]|jgi:hypothetical protein|nr:hypothetical protein [Blastocatellia bacterium]